jgi:aminopeptidase-like protein
MRQSDYLNAGYEMYKWAKELFSYPRSLTGDGVRKTLLYLAQRNSDLKIFEIPTGTKAFDWVIPKEWNIKDAYISDLEGNKLISFEDSNLHVVGYSTPVHRVVTREELDNHLHSIPLQPNAIPYVTSYYKEDWGFCITQIQRESLGDGPFEVMIDATLENGSVTYGEIYYPGESKKEVLFSTYVCHPSMANNELSGPVLALSLANYIKLLKNRKYSYRFLFTVETIGSIYFLSKNHKKLKKNLISGWVLTCVGDNRTFSFLPSKYGGTLADRVSKKVLHDLEIEFQEFSWLERGSDERQFCAPGIDLPVCSIMRSKYDLYPEYHTSLDDLNVISVEGLAKSYEVYQNVIDTLEKNFYPIVTTLCEPQLGRRGLYPTTSTKETFAKVKDMMNIISFCDGKTDAIQISDACNLTFKNTIKIMETLESSKLIVHAKGKYSRDLKM